MPKCNTSGKLKLKGELRTDENRRQSSRSLPPDDEDQQRVEAYVDSTSKPMAIFWDFEQGSSIRLAGTPIESKFYLVGNAVIARGLFEYTGAAGLGAPVRICVSQRDGEDTRIDMDLPSAFFSKFPQTRPSSVPALLDEKLIKLFEDAAA